MNNKRRKELQAATVQIEVAINTIESVADDEQFAYDNLPENFQESERGEKMSDCADMLYDAVDSLNSAIDKIEEARC